MIKVTVRDLRAGANIRDDILPQDLMTLGESLKARQLQPIIVSPDLIILDGWRRYRAAQLVQLDSLWAAITTRALSDEERIAIQLEMDLHRQDFTEQERVLACEQLFAAQPNLDQKALAARLHVAPATVCRWMSVSPHRVITEVRTAFLDGRIGLSAVYPISQAPKESQPDLLAMALAGATRSQLTTHLRRSQSAAPAEHTGRIRCAVAGGGTVTFSSAARSIDGVIVQLKELLQEAKKAREANLDPRTWERVLLARAKAMATDTVATDA
ncbi:MAG: ParB N-terminal domain-containing protein [Planctomycetes bacterium]|nr:ParB N-terminal domain-containing protein [Planctomycetota bacterium]